MWTKNIPAYCLPCIIFSKITNWWVKKIFKSTGWGYVHSEGTLLPAFGDPSLRLRPPFWWLSTPTGASNDSWSRRTKRRSSRAVGKGVHMCQVCFFEWWVLEKTCVYDACLYTNQMHVYIYVYIYAYVYIYTNSFYLKTHRYVCIYIFTFANILSINHTHSWKGTRTTSERDSNLVCFFVVGDFTLFPWDTAELCSNNRSNCQEWEYFGRVVVF